MTPDTQGEKEKAFSSPASIVRILFLFICHLNTCNVYFFKFLFISCDVSGAGAAVTDGWAKAWPHSSPSHGSAAVTAAPTAAVGSGTVCVCVPPRGAKSGGSSGQHRAQRRALGPSTGAAGGRRAWRVMSSGLVSLILLINDSWLYSPCGVFSRPSLHSPLPVLPGTCVLGGSVPDWGAPYRAWGSVLGLGALYRTGGLRTGLGLRTRAGGSVLKLGASCRGSP